jgi:hypothetical protein
MIWPPRPQAALGRKLTHLCEQVGVTAVGIRRVSQRPAPGVSWFWWAENSSRGGHGWAPSLEAARWDLGAFIRNTWLRKGP